MTRAGESNLIFESLHQIEGHLREDRMFFIEILNLRFAWLKSLKTESQMMRVKVIPLGQESGDQRIVKVNLDHQICWSNWWLGVCLYRHTECHPTSGARPLQQVERPQTSTRNWYWITNIVCAPYRLSKQTLYMNNFGRQRFNLNCSSLNMTSHQA